MTDKPYLLNLSRGELEKLLTIWGEPTYRVAQIETWLYSHYVDDATQMTTLPNVLRQLLAEETTIDPLEPQSPHWIGYEKNPFVLWHKMGRL